jgi:hypothetical protein
MVMQYTAPDLKRSAEPTLPYQSIQSMKLENCARQIVAEHFACSWGARGGHSKTCANYKEWKTSKYAEILKFPEQASRRGLVRERSGCPFQM